MHADDANSPYAIYIWSNDRNKEKARHQLRKFFFVNSAATGYSLVSKTVKKEIEQPARNGTTVPAACENAGKLMGCCTSRDSGSSYEIGA